MGLFRLGAVGLELSTGGRGHVSGTRFFFLPSSYEAHDLDMLF
jgi:hypothetical protein